MGTTIRYRFRHSDHSQDLKRVAFQSIGDAKESEHFLITLLCSKSIAGRYPGNCPTEISVRLCLPQGRFSPPLSGLARFQSLNRHTHDKITIMTRRFTNAWLLLDVKKTCATAVRAKKSVNTTKRITKKREVFQPRVGSKKK